MPAEDAPPIAGAAPDPVAGPSEAPSSVPSMVPTWFEEGAVGLSASDAPSPEPSNYDSLLDWSTEDEPTVSATNHGVYGSESSSSEDISSSLSAGATVGLAVGGVLVVAAVAIVGSTARGNALGRRIMGDSRFWRESPASPLASADEVTTDMGDRNDDEGPSPRAPPPEAFNFSIGDRDFRPGDGDVDPEAQVDTREFDEASDLHEGDDGTHPSEERNSMELTSVEARSV